MREVGERTDGLGQCKAFGSYSEWDGSHWKVWAEECLGCLEPSSCHIVSNGGCRDTRQRECWLEPEPSQWRW